MRRLSLRAVVALTVPAFFASPSALAQYAADYGRGGDEPPAAIALFSQENFYGDVRDVYDPFSTLKDLGFSDRARSVAVFAGQWELCEHWNFTGRCVFIREDVSDLGWFGLAGKVTSVRPVYEYTEAQHGLMFTRDKYGYIRYADNEVYGYDTWSHGYASSWGISVSHYGYSPDYYRYGYYSPTWGYDPYGFAWGPRGTIRYTTTTYRRLPRPVVINPYWSGWDYRRVDWRRGHWSWRGSDDWRDHRDRRGGGHGGGHRDGRGDGHGGGDWRPGDTGGGGDRPRRDVPGDRWGPGAGGSGTVAPVTTDPRPGRGGGDRRGRDSVTTPVPSDPGTGRGGRGDRDGRGGRGSGGGGFSTGTPAVAPIDSPRPDGRLRGGEPGSLLGGPSTVVSDPPGDRDGWRRGRGDGGDRSGRSGEGGSGRRSDPPPATYSPPPPPPPAAAPPSRPEVSRDRPRDSGKGGFRRRNGDD
jgi:hypothetical protein